MPSTEVVDDPPGAAPAAAKASLLATIKTALSRSILPVLVLTALAAGAGGLLGTQIVGAVKRATLQADLGAANGPYAGDTVLELKPVITNLLAPAGTWVRLQAAIVYDRTALPHPEVTAAEIGDDILAYLKSVSLSQLQGASGLVHVREDLNERAGIRSDGQVRELVLETLVVQ